MTYQLLEKLRDDEVPVNPDESKPFHCQQKRQQRCSGSAGSCSDRVGLISL
jgi:hypothetical protein